MGHTFKWIGLIIYLYDIPMAAVSLSILSVRLMWVRLVLGKSSLRFVFSSLIDWLKINDQTIQFLHQSKSTCRLNVQHTGFSIFLVGLFCLLNFGCRSRIILLAALTAAAKRLVDSWGVRFCLQKSEIFIILEPWDVNYRHSFVISPRMEILLSIEQSRCGLPYLTINLGSWVVLVGAGVTE